MIAVSNSFSFLRGLLPTLVSVHCTFRVTKLSEMQNPVTPSDCSKTSECLFWALYTRFTFPKVTYKALQGPGPCIFVQFLLTHHNHPTPSSLFCDSSMAKFFHLFLSSPSFSFFLLERVFSFLFTRPTPSYASGFSSAKPFWGSRVSSASSVLLWL